MSSDDTSVLDVGGLERTLRSEQRRSKLTERLLSSLAPHKGESPSDHVESLLGALRRQCQVVLEVMGFYEGEVGFRVTDPRKPLSLQNISEDGSYVVLVPGSIIPSTPTRTPQIEAERKSVAMRLSNWKCRSVQLPDIAYAFSTGRPIVFWRSPETYGDHASPRFQQLAIYKEILNYYGTQRLPEFDCISGLNAYCTEVAIPVGPILVTLRDYRWGEENVPRDAVLSAESMRTIQADIAALLPYAKIMKRFGKRRAKSGKTPSLQEVIAHLASKGFISPVSDADRERVEGDNPAPFPFLPETVELFRVFRDSAEVTFKLALEQAQLHREAATDPLTGLYNRRHTMAVLEHCYTKGRPVSLILADLDYFKRINDEHGHPAGDAVLTAVGKCLESAVRRADTVGRVGGEEFAIVLPNTGLETAVGIAARIRESLDGQVVRYGSAEIRATASFGVAASTQGPQTAAKLYKYADDALDDAKKAGRNSVCTFDGPRAA